jgi:hypothetical protein
MVPNILYKEEFPTVEDLAEPSTSGRQLVKKLPPIPDLSKFIIILLLL